MDKTAKEYNKKVSLEEVEEFVLQDKKKYERYCVCDECGEDYNACVCDDNG